MLKSMKTKVAAIGSASLVTGAANAALPTEAATAVTAVETFATDMIAVAWPIVATVTVALVGIKLFKKFVSRAT